MADSWSCSRRADRTNFDPIDYSFETGDDVGTRVLTWKNHLVTDLIILHGGEGFSQDIGPT